MSEVSLGLALHQDSGVVVRGDLPLAVFDKEAFPTRLDHFTLLGSSGNMGGIYDQEALFLRINDLLLDIDLDGQVSGFLPDTPFGHDLIKAIDDPIGRRPAFFEVHTL